MPTKDELIAGIIKKDLRHIRKLLKEQEAKIKNIDKNGFDKEVHPGNRDGIWTGLHYTQGYCYGHINVAENLIDLLSQKNAKDIKAIIKENEEIDKKNREYLKKIFKDVREKVKVKNHK